MKEYQLGWEKDDLISFLYFYLDIRGYDGRKEGMKRVLIGRSNGMEYTNVI